MIETKWILLGDTMVNLNSIIKIAPGKKSLLFYNIGDKKPLEVPVEDADKAFLRIMARLKVVKIQ